MSERVAVVVYDTQTGAIRQKVQCVRGEEHLQHLAWPGHDFVEVTGQDIHPNEHAIDLVTKEPVARTDATASDFDSKRRELIEAAVGAVGTSEDVTNLLLKAASGDEAAKATAAALATKRQSSQRKLVALLELIPKAKSKTDLAKIRWDA